MGSYITDVSSGDNDPPILLLPNEITAKIFTHCLPELPSVDLGPDPICPSPREAPLLLGQICGQWRDLCIGTPVLWAYVAFAKGSIQLLELWLSRTQNHPLTILLQIPNDTARADMFMKAIMPHRSRWKEVALFLPVRALNQLSLSSLPHLERLTLRATGLRSGNPPIIIRDTPLLRYADLSFLPQLDLPFEQLTTLRTRLSFDTTEALAIGVLRRCQNLLDLFWGKGFMLDAPTLPPIELPRLRLLATDDGSLMDYLTVPRLEQLEIHTFDAEPEVLRSLMLRSSCDLRVLSLMGTCLTPAAQLQDLFRTVNTVVHLKLDRTSIEIQSPALAGHDILPRLKHLEICEDVGHGYDYRALTGILSWRHEEGTLVRFELLLQEYMPIPFAAAMAAFRALADRGLHVRVTHDKAVLLDA